MHTGGRSTRTYRFSITPHLLRNHSTPHRPTRTILSAFSFTQRERVIQQWQASTTASRGARKAPLADTATTSGERDRTVNGRISSTPSHGNLPTWAGGEPKAFWSMADRHERANGAAYREHEIALPSELTRPELIVLAERLAQRLAGTKPYQYACPHGHTSSASSDFHWA